LFSFLIENYERDGGTIVDSEETKKKSLERNGCLGGKVETIGPHLWYATILPYAVDRK
jgi:hypothetical protein